MEYTTLDPNLYISEEDTIRIYNVLLDNGQMKGSLKQEMMDHVLASSFSYENLAEVAVLYSTKMDKTFKAMFFDKAIDKFVGNMPYLKEDTLYKILWSMFKAERLTSGGDFMQWFRVRSIIQKRLKEFSPKVLTNILALSTLAQKSEDKSD